MSKIESIRPDAEGQADLWLHPEAGPDGRVVIKDASGRQLRGVRSIKFSSAMDQANEITVTFLCGTDGPMTNRAKAANAND